ncbi:MAG TPA: hypothetical protein VMM80_11325, partial [Bacteroidota bacterium]|nr:hypothetical protein [Bacteroidota bacterium]
MRFLTPALAALALAAAPALAQTVDITTPADNSVICLTAQPIVGTITWDPNYTLYAEFHDYRKVGTNAWTYIGGFDSPPSAGSSFTGTLTTWSFPQGLPDGRYLYRVTVITDAGADSDVAEFYVDGLNPTLTWTSPAQGSRIRGLVPLVGTSSDTAGTTSVVAEYRQSGIGGYLPCNTTGLAPGQLATWDTRTVADGVYDLRVTANDPCGGLVVINRIVTVDNTPPLAAITAPAACGRVSGFYTVRGQATDASPVSWTLAYLHNSGTWATIATGNVPVAAGGTIAVWDTRAVPRCASALRLEVSDSAVGT